MKSLGQVIKERRTARAWDVANTAEVVSLAEVAFFEEVVPKRQITVLHRSSSDIVVGQGFNFMSESPSYLFKDTKNMITLNPAAYGLYLKAPEDVSYGLTEEGGVLQIDAPAGCHSVLGETAIRAIHIREVVGSPMLVAVLGQVAARANVPEPIFRA